MCRRIVLLFLVLVGISGAVAQDTLTGNFEPLSVTNIDQITEINRFGDGTFTNEGSWSPDGERIAVSGSLGLWLFAVADLQNPEFLPYDTAVNDAVWSPDGTTLTVATDEATHVLDSVSHEVIQSFDGVVDIAYSPNGDYLGLTREVNVGFTGVDVGPVFEVYDTTTGDQMGSISGSGYANGHSLFTTDNRFWITVSSCYQYYCDNAFQIWSMDEPFPVLPWPADPFDFGTAGEVIEGGSPVALDGSRIAYRRWFEDSHTIFILDAASGEETTITLPTLDIHWLVDHQSELVVLASAENSSRMLHFIDVESGQITRTVDEYSLFSPISDTLVASTGWKDIHLLRIEGDTLDEVSSYTLAAPDLATIHADGERLIPPKPTCIGLEPAEPETDCGTFSSDHALFASDGQWPNNDVYVWDVTTRQGKLLVEVEPSDHADHFMFNQDDTLLLFDVVDCFMNGACARSMLYGWRVQEDTIAFTIPLQIITQVVFAPENASNLLVVVTRTSVEFINTDTGEIIATLPETNSRVERLAFSTDGTFILTQHRDDTVRVWGIPADE